MYKSGFKTLEMPMSITLTPKIIDSITKRLVELTNKSELSEVHLAAFIDLIEREPSNEELELLSLTRDNNKLLRDIWTILHSPSDDFKDFIINVLANQFSRK